MSELLAMRIEFGIVILTLVVVTITAAMQLPAFFAEPIPVRKENN